MNNCSVYNCDNTIHARGFCSKHYQRFMKHSDVHTNYRRKYRKPDVNFKFDVTESKHNRTLEETLTLRALFGEEISLHDGENAFNGRCIGINSSESYLTKDYFR